MPVRPAGRQQESPPVSPVSWSRVDSRGATWTHADRATLDAHVDALERGYLFVPAPTHLPAAPPVVLYAPSSGSACVGGSCAGPVAAPRSGLFRRR